MVNVMLCHNLDYSKLKSNGCVSPKIDGIRAVYEPGCTYLISRNHKPIYGMDHIIRALSDMRVPVDMELVVPGMEFNELSGLIRNHQPTPEAIAHVFDVIMAGTLYHRLRHRPKTSGPIIQVPHYRVGPMRVEYIQMKYAEFISEGFEGLVWKDLDSQYTGNRSWAWQRLVPTQTYDVKVEALYEGKGKLLGMCGGFYFKLNGHLCKCGTMKDIDHGERAYMMLMKNEYIGRTAEVEIKEFQPSGMPRQPRFKRWRDDK